jgi:hypothetical protein
MTRLNWKDNSDGSRYAFGPFYAARASREVGGVYHINRDDYRDCYAVLYKPRGSQGWGDTLGKPVPTLREAMDVAEADHVRRVVRAREGAAR